MLFSLLSTLSILIVGFCAGLILRHRFPGHAHDWSYWCTRAAFQGAIPLSLLAAIWQLDNLDANLLLLTVVGSGVILSGGVMSWFLSRWMHLTPHQAGAFIPAGIFMNIGAIGAFCVYMVLGEDGLALVPLYKLLEEVIYFSIAFPIARHFGTDLRGPHRPFWRDPMLLTTLAAVGSGFVLNLSGLPRPGFMSHVSAVVVPLGTLLLMTSVGLVFRLSDGRGLLIPAFLLAACRALLSPLVALGLATALGLWEISDGLPVKVAFLLAFMPTAFLSLLPPVLYGVDQKIANTSWMVSSLGFLFIFPLALFGLQMFPG